ncbi:MAG: hypothetical protein EOP68_18680 [Sphingomonas sp.]|nr:MAG: hypothetical protein EOP68_18680 [Sphingomonas sp.]
MTNRHLLAIAAALSTLGIAACSGRDSEPAPVENQAEATPSEEPRAEIAPAPVTPAPTATETEAANAIAAVPPEEAPAPDAQMMDDAAATGMTARATRDMPASNEDAPVEQVEKK